MIRLGTKENAPSARETLCPGCPSLASPALSIKTPYQSTCATLPGQFKKKTFPTQNLKTERTHLAKGALNVSFCGRQDADTAHSPQSLVFLTQGTHAALAHKPRSAHPLPPRCFSVPLPTAQSGFRRGFTATSCKVQGES